MKIAVIIIGLFISSSQIFASGSQHDEHQHENLDAHVHGHAKLLIVVEKNIVDILMEASADTFIGFEHRPKTKKEIAAYKKFYTAWTKENNKIFIFPKKFGCRVKGANSSWKGKKSDKHKNLALAAKYMCQPPIQKTEIKMVLEPYFDRVKEIEIDVLPLKDMPYTKEAKNNKKTKEITLKL